MLGPHNVGFFVLVAVHDSLRTSPVSCCASFLSEVHRRLSNVFPCLLAFLPLRLNVFTYFHLSKVWRPLDHDPVMVQRACAPDMFRLPPPSQPTLDVDILGITMKTGYRSEAFIEKS